MDSTKYADRALAKSAIDWLVDNYRSEEAVDHGNRIIEYIERIEMDTRRLRLAMNDLVICAIDAVDAKPVGREWCAARGRLNVAIEEAREALEVAT